MTNAVSAATAIAALAAAAAAATAAASSQGSSISIGSSSVGGGIGGGIIKATNHSLQLSSEDAGNGSNRRNHSTLLLAADHLPLQLTTAKVDQDFEIDIQLLTNGYDGTTLTSYYNETSWTNASEMDTIVGEEPEQLSLVSIVVVGIFLSVLIFLSVAGNILVCLAIYTERSLRRIGNLFLASLAIADLFVASLVMTFAGVNDLLGYWIFGAEFCDTWVAFDVMCSTASILNLCAISMDRYIHIKDPLRLYCYAQKHVKSIKAVTRPGEVAEKQRYKSIRRPKNQPKKFKVRNLHHSSPYHVSDHKAAVTVGVIMGVFLICWVPFFCVNITAAFCKTCIGGQTFKILTWLGYSNSAFNPIIYSIFNKEFRDAFKRILTMRNPWCCAQDVGNIHPRNSDRFITDYAAKNVVVMNSGRSSAELEQVSAI
ncbi:dopamine receptor 1 isoform X2 [Drosophila sulfurigaster albostrigata]|uniref:dopamine receptor 1 isoform X2 n=1 Tax=Drosophila sulfurigaster albostrigata TaxID=89887 RepID=UPI002D218D2D|nr:dopamine receptor 1 isoform X2 [Drosophila sulfurigaster albostrigata]